MFAIAASGTCPNWSLYGVPANFARLASFRAASQLLDAHPDNAPLVLNLGTASGIDIESRDGEITAEVFASVDPKNNNKLEHDVARVAESDARFRYVFYLWPIESNHVAELEERGVCVCWLPLADALTRGS